MMKIQSNIIQLNNYTQADNNIKYYDSEILRKQYMYVMQKVSLFDALSMAKELNELNGCKLITDHDIRQVKLYHTNGEHMEQTEDEKYQEAINRINENRKKEILNNKSKLMQKGYMKLLTKSAYQNSI